ncbi:MAG: hypothetical protein ACI8W7_003316 [Gammaproteobacteria bacterium]
MRDTPAVHGGRSQLLPTIVRHSRRPWRSVAIVPDNCATLPPSMAVGRNCSRQLCDTPAVHGGRIQQSILSPRALLSRRSDNLILATLLRPGPLVRNVAGRGGAVHKARHAVVIVAHRVVHGAAVVPHQHIADLPLMPIDVFCGRCTCGEHLE